MSHAAFLDALPPQTRIELAERSDRAGLSHLAVHAGAVAVLGALLIARVPFWWALVPVQGVLIAFLFTLQHECTHRTPFASRGLNEWTGRIAGLLIFQPFEWFRHFHLAHHRHTHDPERDPELAGGGKPGTRAEWLIHVSGWPYWSGQARTFLAALRGRMEAHYLPRTARPRIVREARAMIGVYVGVLAFSILVSPALWRAWLLPVVVGMPALRLYVLAEHGRCPHVADLFVNTRTTLTGALMRRLAWNMPFHAEHHGLPNVPFHKLPRLHELARPHLGTVEDGGYAGFTRDYVAGLRS